MMIHICDILAHLHRTFSRDQVHIGDFGKDECSTYIVCLLIVLAAK
jgi:hypothetical protein